MLRHLLELHCTIPAHALVAAWRHGRVPWRSHANNALRHLLPFLIYLEYLNRELLLVEVGARLLAGGSRALELATLATIGGTGNKGLLQLVVLITNVVWCFSDWWWRVNDLGWLWGLDRVKWIKTIWRISNSLLSLDTSRLQLFIDFQEENEGVAAHEEEKEQGQ